MRAARRTNGARWEGSACCLCEGARRHQLRRCRDGDSGFRLHAGGGAQMDDGRREQRDAEHCRSGAERTIDDTVIHAAASTRSNR